MNRFFTTVSDRKSVKRIGLVGISMIFLAASFMVFPTRANAAACAAPTGDFGSASATIKIDNSTKYRIWSRIMSADANNNSYLLEVDGNTCYVVGDSNNLVPGAWTWVDYQNGSGTSTKMEQTLTTGDHSIKMIGREAGVKLGRVLFVSDTACVPTGNGDNCATTGDTVAPTVDITAPVASATVSNAVTVNANASDNVGVNKVEFYVNGALKATDTTSPYSYNWDSKTSGNGSASLMAKAYDAAGNSSSDTVQVTVANGDTQAPTVPAGVTATANSATRVTVKWNVSTDNTAVTGYWVSRNGQVLARVTSGTQYVDDAVLPNTAYSYKVSALDAAGNTSALSAEAKVTTPNAPDTQAPSVPATVTAKAMSTSQIDVAWGMSTDNVAVSGYDVYRAVGTGAATKVATVTSLSYGDTGLAADTSYSYYVVARDAAGNVSQKSTVATAKTEAKPPTVTTGILKGQVTFASNSEKHAHVTITVRGVKRIYDTDSKGNYTISNLPAGTYRVRYDAQGSYSKVVTVKVKAAQTKTQNVTLRRR